MGKMPSIPNSEDRIQSGRADPLLEVSLLHGSKEWSQPPGVRRWPTEWVRTVSEKVSKGVGRVGVEIGRLICDTLNAGTGQGNQRAVSSPGSGRHPPELRWDGEMFRELSTS